MRTLLAIHRYLGIAVSVLMVMWCLSGAVMLYVSYPRLPEAERLRGLSPLDLRHCCARLEPGRAIAPETAIRSLRVETMAHRTVAAIITATGARDFMDLRTGEILNSVNLSEATAAASEFAQRHGLGDGILQVGLLKRDLWTVSAQFDADRPLYKLSLPDAAHTELYVSSASGKVLQLTTRAGRFWNWLGAVPHWLYFVPLRRHDAQWQLLIIATSGAGIFLTLTGLCIGILRLQRGAARRLSPYGGYMLWHHVGGLLFGLFLLSWTASGMLSVNPWRLLEGEGAGLEQRHLAGAPRSLKAVLAAALPIGDGLPAGAYVSLRTAPLGGQLFFIATTSQGDEVRLSASGEMAPLSGAERSAAAKVLGSADAPVLLASGDELYFRHHSESVRLPVYKVSRSDKDRTQYYLDATSGEIVSKFDGAARGYRWLFEGTHRLDLSSRIRERPGWDALVLALLGGCGIVSATGLYSALLRMSGRGTRL